jgi:hypothetical protein
MSHKILTLILLLFSCNAFAVKFPIEITEYIDEVKVDAFINEADLNSTAKWTPFDAAPALSVGAALEAIKQYLHTDKHFTETSLSGIELKPVPGHDAYWHYLIKMNGIADGKSQAHFFVVLMDGKVIAALAEPESIK